jgi:CheY-like chemotaxis protein
MRIKPYTGSFNILRLFVGDDFKLLILTPKIRNNIMEKIKILWADDEIDLLKPHVMFLEQKGFDVDTVTNGDDALEHVQDQNYDIVFLDENMPGLSGLETLSQIKNKKPNTPVVMITKSEEESIMEDAIGSKISDYLIKPVNPNQILLTIKKNLDTRRLVSEKTTTNYQQEFRKIGMELGAINSWEEWVEMYQRLVYWELELESLEDPGMHEILKMQKDEANNLFTRFIENNYQDWLHGAEDKPTMSHTVFKNWIAPHLGKGKPVFLFMIDNLRHDQWKVVEKAISPMFRTESEKMYMSILPTATQFARNAFFAGLMPLEIERRHPDLWVNDTEEGSKNASEDVFLKDQLKRLGLDIKMSYHKVIKQDFAKKLASNMKNLAQNDLNVIVYNFVDMLSHAKTDMEVIRELAEDDKAYRSLTESWFNNSPLLDMIRSAHEMGADVIITTDHGTINVDNPVKVVGDRNTNTNLRYKQGKSLNYDPKEVFFTTRPKDFFLPAPNVSTSYIFAKSNDFFAYPNNYNYYVSYYRNTFQHGGVSLEEMIIPLAILKAK